MALKIRATWTDEQLGVLFAYFYDANKFPSRPRRDRPCRCDVILTCEINTFCTRLTVIKPTTSKKATTNLFFGLYGGNHKRCAKAGGGSAGEDEL